MRRTAEADFPMRTLLRLLFLLLAALAPVQAAEPSARK